MALETPPPTAAPVTTEKMTVGKRLAISAGIVVAFWLIAAAGESSWGERTTMAIEVIGVIAGLICFFVVDVVLAKAKSG